MTQTPKLSSRDKRKAAKRPPASMDTRSKTKRPGKSQCGYAT